MIALASDHGGFELKETIKAHLDECGIAFRDFGCGSRKSVDYVDFAYAACEAVKSGECRAAVLCCGTGIGMSIAANKVNGIRAACCSDCFSAKYTRMHNNANVLCLGGRVVGEGLACMMVDVFLSTEFDGGGRHELRLEKIRLIEESERAGKKPES